MTLSWDVHSGKSLTRSLTSTTARILAARPWLAPLLGFLVLLAGAAAWLSVKPEVERRVPARLLIENLRKDVRLDAVRLTWTTTLPARAAVKYWAPGEPKRRLEVDEPLGTVHQALITGLSHERDYQVALVSTTATGEVVESAPIPVKLFAGAWSEALAAIRKANVSARILEVFAAIRRLDRDALRALLAAQVDPLRAPLAQVRKVSREFFDSPGVPPRAKLEVYGPLKQVEHLERLAAVRKLPMLQILSPFDWGIYGQREVPDSMSSKHSSWTTSPQFVTEWRGDPRELDALVVFARGERDGARELTFRFPLGGEVASAELWLGYGACSPLQYFELAVNGAAPLIIRPPLETPPGGRSVSAVGVDPMLLRAGENVVKVRLKPLPEVLEGRRTQVWFLELRSRGAGDPPWK